MPRSTQQIALEMLLKSEEFKKQVRKAAKETEKVGDGTEKASKKSTSFLKQMKAGWLAVAAVVTAVARAVIRFGKVAIKAAEENEVAQLKFQKVFRGSMKVALQSVDDLTRSYAMSNTEATIMLSKVQDMLVPMGLMRSEAAKVSGNVIKLTADIAAFNGKPTAEVMQAIQSAMVGMNRPMLNYGVTLTAATVKQEAFNLKLFSGTGELSAAARAQAALSLIVKGSGDALDAVADQWDTWAISMKRIKAFGDDVTNMIGDELMKAFKPAIKMIADFIGEGEGLEKVRDGVERVITVMQVAVGIVRLLKDSYFLLYNSIRTVLELIPPLLKVTMLDPWIAVWDTIKATVRGDFDEIGDIWVAAAEKAMDDLKEVLDRRLAVMAPRWEKIQQDLADIENAGNKERAKDGLETAALAAGERYEMEMEKLRAHLGTKEAALIEFGESRSAFEALMADANAALETDRWKMAVKLAKQGLSDISKLVQANAKADQIRIKKNTAARILELEKERAAGLITEEQFQDAKAKAERRGAVLIAKSKRKAFFAERRAKIAEIVMATALAIVSAFRLGPVAGAIAAAAIGVLSGIQIAAVQAQEPPEIPALAAGGVAGLHGPQLALLGERGPEIVIPAAQTRDIMSGDTNNSSMNFGPESIVLHVNGGTPGAVREELVEALNDLSDASGRGSFLRG